MKILNTLTSIVCAGFMAALPACSSISSAQWQAALNDTVKVIDAVEPFVAEFAQTGKVDYAQAIPTAFNVLAVFTPSSSVDVKQLGNQVAKSVQVYGQASGSTAQKIAAAFIAALPANNGTISGVVANAALTNAGIGASAGANGATVTIRRIHSYNVVFWTLRGHRS